MTLPEKPSDQGRFSDVSYSIWNELADAVSDKRIFQLLRESHLGGPFEEAELAARIESLDRKIDSLRRKIEEST